MKKLLLTFSLLVSVIAAKALTATIYVKADTAPFLYGWSTVNGLETKINGGWPGKQMTETTVKVTSAGQPITFWYQTVEIEATSFNIIFNNGNTANMAQTGNISNISSDRYFTYDGERTYEDITDQFGVEIPDVEIQSIALVSELNEWNGLAQLFTEVEKNKKYTFNLEISDEELATIESYYSFKILVNSSAYLGWDNVDKGLTLDNANGWMEENIAASGNIGIDLSAEGANTKALLFTVTFAGGKDIYQGWTLGVEAGSSGVNTLTVVNSRDQKRYNLAGQQVASGFRGLVIQNGRKMLAK